MTMNEQTHQTKVLVVEDDFIASKTAQMVLESKGCYVECVFTGKEAIERLNNCYDLIILDLGLPDIQGLEAAQIVIVTAFDVKEDKEIANQLGISHCISKPFTLEKCDLILESRSSICV